MIIKKLSPAALIPLQMSSEPTGQYFGERFSQNSSFIFSVCNPDHIQDAVTHGNAKKKKHFTGPFCRALLGFSNCSSHVHQHQKKECIHDYINIFQ